MLLTRLLDYSHYLHQHLIKLQVEAAATDEQLCTIFNDEENQSILLEAGCHMVLSSLKLSDKANLLSIMIDYHCIIKPKAAIDQFVEGLSSTGVMHYVQHYPNIMKALFCQAKSSLTAS